ncbi:hypothetical protein AJ79_06886 [Helicocarpus griseus UAMH5409]|uniref:Phenol 2-monooxygenase n=1 Tax=Helicocarpus griseus UAMH5409 TaxID=1447875 RepID=A0A2B7X905_9EURO|nr:hypothetical protein AJ79_06886 [Helicocarpus griseus UAMH5409]
MIPTPASVKESNVDVLIIGAGPAGYMAATWFARMGVDARIIDKRSTNIVTGQADGLQPRSLELLHSFGLGYHVKKEASVGYEACFYEPDEEGIIRKVDTKPEGVPGISRHNGSVIHQGRIENWFAGAIEEFSQGSMRVERPILPESLQIDASKLDSTGAYPVTIVLKKLSDESASPEQFGHKVENGLYCQFQGDQVAQAGEPAESKEIFHAKYVLGCDGAHSWVRKQLGIVHAGETTDDVWGVIDIVPITDFPDIRRRCSIHSKNDGSIMVIPREGDLVRLYIQLTEVPHEPGANGVSTSGNPEKAKDAGEKARADRSKITAEAILEAAQKIFKPYTLEVAETRWFTAYQIGQRIANAFQKDERVFIAGDACHTHSPKAGQGMNVSMQDTYNLAFKIAYVVKGLTKPNILSTYEQERRAVAEDLLSYDTRLAKLFSGKPGEVSTEEFRAVIDKGSAFTTGCTTNYESSLLVDKPSGLPRDVPYSSPLARNLPIGIRIPDAKFITECDGRPWFLHEKLPSNGHFRVLVFIGDFGRIPKLKANLNQIGTFLSMAESFLRKYTCREEESPIEAMLLHCSPQELVDWGEFPLAFRPRNSQRIMDYWKIFADRPSFHDETINGYRTYGIDKTIGAAVVLRPDGHVAKVVEPTTEGIMEINEWFEKFMIRSAGN